MRSFSMRQCLPMGTSLSIPLGHLPVRRLSDNRHMDKYELRRQRLRQLIDDQCGGIAAELAKRIGRDPSYVSRMLYPDGKAGKKRIGDDMVELIETSLGVPRGTLDGYTNPAAMGIDFDLAARSKHSAYQLEGMADWDDSTPLDSDDVEIPLFKEVELAAGDGSTHAIEINGRKLRFSKATLKSAGVDIANAACATASGTSMEPRIADGATIGIDRGRTQIRDGKIYAIDHDGLLRVKYLYRMPGGGLRLRSENDAEYPDEHLSPEEAKSIRVLGWVFWWSVLQRW